MQTELKPYAISVVDSRGREHDEDLPPSVDPFALDRQRVLHSTAFRRLGSKTQVFVSGDHDHFRSRLTHTLEVTSVARRLCVALQVNGMVAELIALTHDLGHPPFGHAGEVALAELMKDHGGFEHNAQSLRIVEYLEHPYPPFRGLNLSYEVRESLAKHCTIFDNPSDHPLADGTQAPIEGQIANLADRVAYDCHDLEDGILADIIDGRELKPLSLWSEAADAVRKRHPRSDLPAVRRPILDNLETILLGDIVAESRRRIATAGIKTIDDVRNCSRPLVDFSDELKPCVEELEQFLLDKLYKHQRLVRMDDRGKRFISELFGAYLSQPRLLPERFADRIEEQGRHHVICDYIAGMTDNFCQEEYRKIFQPFEKV
jgi:dGTPase